MFSTGEKELSLEFARRLAQRDYGAAYALCSQNLQAQLTADDLHLQFESMIPLDWGEVNPIEQEENDAFPFVYVVLGGDVYSEAIIIDGFVVENGDSKIKRFEFGRP